MRAERFDDRRALVLAERRLAKMSSEQITDKREIKDLFYSWVTKWVTKASQGGWPGSLFSPSERVVAIVAAAQ
jgi:hypothetical protein